MIMFFQMFKIQCIYIAVWEAKLCYYVIPWSSKRQNKNKLLTKTSLRLFYSILPKTTLKGVILVFELCLSK